MKRRVSIEVGEALAVRGVLFALDNQLNISVFETDSSVIVDALNRSHVSGVFGPLINEILNLNEHLRDSLYSFGPRVGNGVAHRLDKLAMEVNINCNWTDAISLIIFSLVTKDLY
ncbi:hypothetical protein Sjap_020688 [Stephania japonica]|uniref:RNase H type-1 domain-containing protein n=1 Tax=Stephania japonica TaxID=461633 RepID=A0AAP0FA38_9MAGN